MRRIGYSLVFPVVALTGAGACGRIGYDEHAEEVPIYLEAESGRLEAPLAVSRSANASGGAFIATPVGDMGKATYRFTVTRASTYVVWGRVLAPDFYTDSFYVQMDGGPEDVYDVAEQRWSPNWQWTLVNGRADTGVASTINPRTFALGAGSHTIVFRGRDASTGLDRIAITDDRAFTP